MAVADVVARAPLLPGAAVAAYLDPRESVVIARAPLLPGADVAAYPPPWGPLPVAAQNETTGILDVVLAGFSLVASGTVADPGGGGSALLLLCRRRFHVTRRRRR